MYRNMGQGSGLYLFCSPAQVVVLISHTHLSGRVTVGISPMIASRKSTHRSVPQCGQVIGYGSFMLNNIVSWADPGGPGGPDPPFFTHFVELLTLGPKLDPLLDPPPLFLLVDLRWTPPPLSKILDPPLSIIGVIMWNYPCPNIWGS